MARTLNAVVYVDGMPYAPGDDIPDEVAKRIGDHAWTEDDVERQPAGTRGVGDPVEVPYAGVQSQRAADEDLADEPNTGEQIEDTEGRSLVTEDGDEDLLVQREPVAPPRSGKGSGLEAWRAYAQQLGIEPQPGADRDDLIAAVDAHHLAQREQ